MPRIPRTTGQQIQPQPVQNPRTPFSAWIASQALTPEAQGQGRGLGEVQQARSELLAVRDRSRDILEKETHRANEARVIQSNTQAYKDKSDIQTRWLARNGENAFPAATSGMAEMHAKFKEIESGLANAEQKRLFRASTEVIGRGLYNQLSAHAAKERIEFDRNNTVALMGQHTDNFVANGDFDDIVAGQLLANKLTDGQGEDMQEAARKEFVSETYGRRIQHLIGQRDAKAARDLFDGIKDDLTSRDHVRIEDFLIRSEAQINGDSVGNTLIVKNDSNHAEALAELRKRRSSLSPEEYKNAIEFIRTDLAAKRLEDSEAERQTVDAMYDEWGKANFANPMRLFRGRADIDEPTLVSMKKKWDANVARSQIRNDRSIRAKYQGQLRDDKQFIGEYIRDPSAFEGQSRQQILNNVTTPDGVKSLDVILRRSQPDELVQMTQSVRRDLSTRSIDITKAQGVVRFPLAATTITSTGKVKGASREDEIIIAEASRQAIDMINAVRSSLPEGQSITADQVNQINDSVSRRFIVDRAELAKYQNADDYLDEIDADDDIEDYDPGDVSEADRILTLARGAGIAKEGVRSAVAHAISQGNVARAYNIAIGAWED